MNQYFSRYWTLATEGVISERQEINEVSLKIFPHYCLQSFEAVSQTGGAR